MKYKNLVQFTQSESMNVGYNEDRKAEFVRLARAHFKKVKSLLIESQACKDVVVDYNKAGIAVSGELTLRAEFKDGGAVTAQLSLCMFSGDYGYFRATQGLKDYTGGRNRAMTADLASDPEKLVYALLSSDLQKEAKSL